MGRGLVGWELGVGGNCTVRFVNMSQKLLVRTLAVFGHKTRKRKRPFVSRTCPKHRCSERFATLSCMLSTDASRFWNKRRAVPSVRSKLKPSSPPVKVRTA